MTSFTSTRSAPRRLCHDRTPEGEWSAWWADNAAPLTADWRERFDDEPPSGEPPSVAQTFIVAPRLEGLGASLSSAVGALIVATVEQAIVEAGRLDGTLGVLGDDINAVLGGLADDALLMLEARACAQRALHAAERRLQRGGPADAARADVVRAYHVLQVCECLRIQAQQPRRPAVRRGAGAAQVGSTHSPGSAPNLLDVLTDGPSSAAAWRRVRRRHGDGR